MAAVLAVAIGASGCVGMEKSEALASTSVATSQAARSLEVQGAIDEAELPQRLEAATGADFGGLWYDQATAQLHVGVTSDAAQHAAAAVAAKAGVGEYVTATPVRVSWAQLGAEQEALSRLLTGRLLHSQAATWATWPDPVHNSVDVELDVTVPASEVAALERAGAGFPAPVAISFASPFPVGAEGKNACNKFAASKAYCDTLSAGVTIESAVNKCTAGPALILQDLSTPAKATETFLLTAGHCISNGGGNGKSWFANTTKPSKEEIGLSLEYQNAELDAGVIKVEKAPWLTPGFIPLAPTIVPWVEAAPKPFAVTGENASVIGKNSCLSGQTSSTLCGKILKTKLEFKWPKGEISKELVEVGLKGAGGDSGGPFFSEATKSLVEGTDVGTINTGNEVFQPIADSLAKLSTKFQLLTTANETRHAKKFRAKASEATISSTADGTGKTAHHVFDAAGGSLTCGGIALEGTQTTEVASEVAFSAAYKECTFIGQVATVSMGGCGYVLHSSEEFEIASQAGKNCATEPIRWEVAGCKVEVLPQSREILTFANIKPGSVNEVTMGMNLTGIAYKSTGATCPKQGEFSDGLYTTGNTILTAAKPGGGEMIGYTWE